MVWRRLHHHKGPDPCAPVNVDLLSARWLLPRATSKCPSCSRRLPNNSLKRTAARGMSLATRPTTHPASGPPRRPSAGRARRLARRRWAPTRIGDTFQSAPAQEDPPRHSGRPLSRHLDTRLLVALRLEEHPWALIGKHRHRNAFLWSGDTSEMRPERRWSNRRGLDLLLARTAGPRAADSDRL